MDFSCLTILPRGRQVWDKLVFPDYELDSRLDAFHEMMEAKGLDGILVFSDAASRRYVNYLTFYCNSVNTSGSICVLPKNGTPVIISTMSPRDITYTKKLFASRAGLEAVGLSLKSVQHVAAKTIEYLEKNGLLAQKWGGVNTHNLPIAGFMELEKHLPGLVDCTAECDAIMVSKTPAEQFAIAQAAAMAKKAALDYLRLATPGKNEAEVVSLIEREMRSYGAEHFVAMVSAVQSGHLVFRQPKSRIIQEGDTVSINVNIIYLHYNGTYSASVYHGAVDEKRRAFYNNALSRWQEAIALLQTPQNIGTGGLERYIENEGLITAYGIGVDLPEPPFSINKESRIKEGVVLALTVSTVSDEYAEVIMGDTLVVDQDVWRPLSGPGVRAVNFIEC